MILRPRGWIGLSIEHMALALGSNIWLCLMSSNSTQQKRLTGVCYLIDMYSLWEMWERDLWILQRN